MSTPQKPALEQSKDRRSSPVSDRRLASYQDQIDSIRGQLDENTTETKEIKGIVESIQRDTKGVIEMFQSISGAFVALEFLGKLAKPLLWVGGLAAGTSMFWSDFTAAIAKMFTHK